MPILTEDALKLKLPKMIKVEQIFETQEVTNFARTIKEELHRQEIKPLIKPNMNIAIAVGSRGIYNLDNIVKNLIYYLKEMGANPFIVPAMGSHGGATAEGQREVLINYGIIEEKMKAPIKSSMEVVKIGETKNKVPVYVDKIANESDMIIPVARIKPHTDFEGKIESGICKMLAIGLGKHKGCSTLHSQGFDTFSRLIPEVGEIILKNTPIGFGLALIENAYDKTAKIKAVAASNVLKEEPILLEQAKKLMPKILVPEIDVLIVERIGKDITGAGMDPNIIGRTTKGKIEGFDGPSIQRIIVLGLTKVTHGNACGIGLADFTTKDVAKEIDCDSTYTNVIASGNPEAGRIPVAMNNEKEAIIAAIQCCYRIDKNNPKIVRIKDTLNLKTIFISENMSDYVFQNKRLKMGI